MSVCVCVASYENQEGGDGGRGGGRWVYGAWPIGLGVGGLGTGTICKVNQIYVTSCH